VGAIGDRGSMVQFSDLWYRHPANLATTYPCIAPRTLVSLEGKGISAGYPVFSNQCAIRMGVCLKHAGITPAMLRGVGTCGVHSPDEMHYFRAQDLANALAAATIPGVGKVEKMVGADAQSFYPKILGRTGI